MSSLAKRLDSLTVEGELYEKLEDNALRCFACGHRCLIRDGKRGICQVRFNQGGKLFVPHGYVAALQSDPIEKKPFAHVFPGTNALTFGMLGCDYHCGYCFTGNTMVITNFGAISLEDAFELGESRLKQTDGEISFPANLKAITSSGEMRTVRGVFRHRYDGDLIQITPYYVPAFRCTPDHRVYATNDVSKPPSLVYAKDLTNNSYLATPKKYKFSSLQVIDVGSLLGSHQITYQTPWKLSKDEMQDIMALSTSGKASHEIGKMFSKSGSYIRHLRTKIKKGQVTETKTSKPYIENGYLRFPNERQPGLPVRINFDVDVAELFGYYCAEGSVVSGKSRPNSFNINFSFSKDEAVLASRVIQLLKKIFNIDGRLVHRATTLSVSTSKSSLALLFKTLAGERSTKKKYRRCCLMLRKKL